MKRINTTKTLSNDNYFANNDYNTDLQQQKMEVSPIVANQYEYALTEDIVLLNDRKDTANKLYDIWIDSPYAKNYQNNNEKKYNIIKIPKEDINKIFYYMKNKLQEIKPLSAYEMVIAINEFFDFNYDYIVKKVLSPKLKSEILEEYYHNGMKERMDNNAQVKLF